MKHLVMEIKNYNSINEAKIEINKINVVGGVNGSGKSTVSKIFYSFLKGNSIKRREYALQRLVDNVNYFIEVMLSKFDEFGDVGFLQVDDEDNEFIEKYYSILEILKKQDELVEIKLVELSEEIENEINRIVKRLNDNKINTSEIDLDCNLSNKILNLLIFFKKGNFDDDFSKDIEKLYEYDKKFMDYSNTDCLYYLCSLSNNDSMNNLFFEESYELSKDSFIGILEFESIADSFSNTNFYIVEDDLHKTNAFEYFFNNGFINGVYYVDNVSILDFLDSKDKLNKKLFHMDEILEELFLKDDEYSFEIKHILAKIESIVKGRYHDNAPNFETDEKDPYDLFGLRYNLETNVTTYNSNTPSGIKQIGIIQILLKNNKLKKDDYLIIDEPEVNLHPDWQFKFAEILVLLAKELNITIFLNSHSPMFIEAIDAFTEFYDMQGDVNYYLTEESEIEGKYNFNKIDSDEIYKIYDNLGNAYDLIDQLRLRKHLGD